MQRELTVHTTGRAFIELTKDVASVVRESGVADGLCNVFVPHTSASIIAGENWDSSVRRDLEAFMSRLVPDGDRRYEHDTEGPDDMPAHIRTMLTQSSIVIPVAGGKLQLGTWQGIYLWEHRTSPHERRVIVTVWQAAP
jgi:secondary thiamine-phosphate synthase enzyme